MGRDRSRVLILLAAYAICLIAGTLVMKWFIAEFGGLDDSLLASTLESVRMSIGLHDVAVCQGQLPCVSISFSSLGRGMGFGWYGTFAAMTLYGGLAVGLLVAFQVLTRVRSGIANPTLTKLGYFGCLYVFAAAGAAGYLFGPEGGSPEQVAVVLTVHRTWAPALTLVAQVIGLFALYYAASPDAADDDAPYVPVVLDKPADHERPSSSAIPLPSTAADRTGPRARPSSALIMLPPELVRGKLSYATLTAELSRGGIDARREDGASKLVMWRDLVGVVARRLPPDYEGTTFVDLVSTAGSTLRVLPWTRLVGEPVEGEAAVRARNLVALVVEHCPTAKLDPATRAFVDGKDAAQLPDLATLAAHDQRLA